MFFLSKIFIMKCYKCECPETKYRCITCGNAVCNICSVSCSEDTPGYSEEYHCTLENENTNPFVFLGDIKSNKIYTNIYTMHLQTISSVMVTDHFNMYLITLI